MSEPIRPECKEEFMRITHALERQSEATEERTRILEDHTAAINEISKKVFNGFGDRLELLEKHLGKVDARVWAILFSVFGAFASSLATLIFFLFRLGIIGG
jgi:hypothetical protein